MDKGRRVQTQKCSWGQLGLECFPYVEAIAQGATPGGKTSCAEATEPGTPVGRRPTSGNVSTQHRRHGTSRKLELLSNVPKAQADRSNPQGLIQTPTKSVNIFTWTFNGMGISPWEAGLKPDSEHLAFHIWHCTHFFLVKKELVGIPE